MFLKFKKFLRDHSFAILAFLCVFGFTIYAYFQSRENARIKREEQFEFTSIQVEQAIVNRMEEYIQVLKGCKALFTATDTVRFSNWSAYVNSINIYENYPGIQGIGYTPIVKGEDLAAHISQIRSEGFPSYNVEPFGSRPVYTPLTYIEPFESRNLRGFGFDLYTDPVAKETMEGARDTQKPTISGKVTLVQETEKNIQPGILLFLPLYQKGETPTNVNEARQLIKGFVYSPFRTFDLMNSILMIPRFKDVDIEVYAGNEMNEKSLIYNKDPKFAYYKDRPSKDLAHFSSINIANHPFKIYTTAFPSFGSASEKSQPLLILLGGTIISLLFGFSAYVVSRSRHHAIRNMEIAKELERKKDEFIGIASHELKTPLTSVKAYLQLLERMETNDISKVYLVKTSNHINKLGSLISDLLDVSKVQAGKLEFNITSFNFDDLVDESIETVQHTHKTHKIIRKGGLNNLMVKGDKARLEQVFINFLTNAIKYSPKADTVIVTVERDGDNIITGVQDFGIGIPKEKQQRVFDRFYRVENLAPTFAGLGIGLFIASQIINRHNGRVWLESEVGKGSTFYFSLPIVE